MAVFACPSHHYGNLWYSHKNTYKSFCKTDFKDSTYYHESSESFDIFYLDSSKGKIDFFQRKWLKKSLIKYKQNNIIIFIHHPILTCSNWVMERKYPLKNKNKIISILTKNKKNIYIFCGHYHNEEQTSFANITQFLTPSSVVQMIISYRRLSIAIQKAIYLLANN